MIVYRDAQGRWIGTFRVIDSNDKVIIVDQEGRLVRHSVDRVKHVKMEEDARSIVYYYRIEAENALRELSSTRVTNQNDSKNTWNIPDPLGEFSIRIIERNDHQAPHEDFKQAKKVEVNCLVLRKIWL